MFWQKLFEHFTCMVRSNFISSIRSTPLGFQTDRTRKRKKKKQNNENSQFVCECTDAVYSRAPSSKASDTPGDFFRRSRRCGSFENSCDKIAQPDGLALLAIRSNKRRKSRERAHLANACEFNRRYLTCQIPAILYADRGDRRIKSPSVSLA